MPPCRSTSGRRVRIAAIVAASWVAASDLSVAQEQTAAETPRRTIVLGARGGPVGEAQGGTDGKANELTFSARAGFATDYIYRGVTLSDRKAAMGAGVEAAFDKLYAGVTFATVRLPTEPSAEISFAAGIRPTIGKVDFDLAWTYYAYPREALALLGPTGGTDYWEASLRAETQLTDLLRVGGGFAWTPSVSNTGASATYIAAGLSFDLPRRLLPRDLAVSVSGSAGYSRFGAMDDVLGGFPLPSYVNWNAGVTFTHKVLNLDLRYYDTNLSRENCYVFTGDPGAVAGGAIDPLRNPDGLRSRWCGAALVGKLWFALN